MDAFTHAVWGWIAQNSAWAGLVIGALTFGESLLVIGAFLPATVVLIAAGGLIAIGAVDGVSVILFALGGAILGDAVSYLLGRKLGEGLLDHAWLVKHKTMIGRARDAAARHGVLALFIGRFGGPLRAFVPVMAGVAGMSPLRFHLANAASAVFWVAAFIAPGYLAARGLEPNLRLDLAFALLLALAAAALIAAGLAVIMGDAAVSKPKTCGAC